MSNESLWRERLLAWLKQSDVRPLSKSELARTLGAQPEERAVLRRTLDDLVREGLAEVRKGGRYGPAGGKPDLARGLFETTFRGQHSVRILFGGKALAPDADGVRRLPIPIEGAGTALHGDVVEVRLKRRGAEPFRRGGGRQGRDDSAEPAWEGRVTAIVEEGRRTTTGIFRQQGRHRFIEVEDKKYPDQFDVLEIASGCAPVPGDLVLATVVRWDSPQRNPGACVLKVLGDPKAPGNDVLALMHRFDLPKTFPPDVVAEAAAMPDEVRAGDLTRRDDWRERLVVTIDPFDARDFDDAIHVTARPDGWTLAVHIADVSHYVKPGTALDREARERGNSTYLVDRVIPMLPENLSNGLCSLVPGKDRLTRLVLMEFDARGRLESAKLGSAVIRSARRFTYEEAFALLQQPEASLAEDRAATMLHEAWRLAAVLRKRRFQNGSLDLDFPEIKIVLDAAGRPVEMRKVEHDMSHQLIEEFMLAANETVASTLRTAGMACIHRVHDDPDEAKLWEFRELARLHGFPVGDLSGRSVLRKLLARIRGEPEEHALKLSLLKSLKRACYSADPRGHYGLAKQNYLHFTSPIRRYADLVAHRVSGAWSGHLPRLPVPVPGLDQLEETAAHLSITERVSAEAEIESKKMKEMEFFERLLLAEDPQVFTAVVTEARRLGLMIELVDLQIKGLVPVHAFPPGSWWYEGESRRWQISRGRHELKAGSKFLVRILRVDRDNKFLDFAHAGEVAAVPRKTGVKDSGENGGNNKRK